MPDQNEEDISRVGGSHGNEAESGHLGSTGSNKFWFLKKKKKKKKKKKNGRGRDDDDNHEEERHSGHIDNKQKVSKANEMVPFPLKKAKQRLSFPTKSPPSTSISSASFPGQFGSCSCFCFKHPRMMSESSVASPKSDPNSPNFTLSMLTSLIENNDFYSKECNPHLVHTGAVLVLGTVKNFISVGDYSSSRCVQDSSTTLRVHL